MGFLVLVVLSFFTYIFLVGLGEVGLPHLRLIQVSEIGQTLSPLFVGS